MAEYRQTIYRPPAGAADLLLVRHGESAPAIPGQSFPLKDGHGDPALYGNGPAQAEAVGRRLSGAAIKAIYVTKLRRTHETSAPLARILRRDPVEDPDLHEVHLGDWDGGLYRQKAAERDPVYLEMLEKQDWGVIPGAEPRAAFNERIKRGLSRIAAAHTDERVAVVVHGGVIAAALSMAAGSAPFAFQGAANGSISRLVVRGDSWQIRAFNDTAHLSGMGGDF
ncbi:MAG: histidine phosphatase family protein [Pseudomonadota bacterium]